MRSLPVALPSCSVPGTRRLATSSLHLSLLSPARLIALSPVLPVCHAPRLPTWLQAGSVIIHYKVAGLSNKEQQKAVDAAEKTLGDKEVAAQHFGLPIESVIFKVQTSEPRDGAADEPRAESTAEAKRDAKTAGGEVFATPTVADGVSRFQSDGAKARSPAVGAPPSMGRALVLSPVEKAPPSSARTEQARWLQEAEEAGASPPCPPPLCAMLRH